jgi:hypothetical protein
LLFICSINQCFKTRPGPAGQPGTRPTRACGLAGSKQKTGWELAWPDPVDQEGWPGTRPARPNPAETRVYFFYILMHETTSFWPFTIKRPKQQEQETNHEHCRLEKWEEDLINFKNLSNPFHSQSWRRVDEQKNLESLIAVSILSIRLDEFLIISFFFRLSLCFIFFPLLKLQESITVASILPSVQSVDPSVLPFVPSVDPSVLPTD